MIKADRRQADDSGVPILPSDGWFERAAAETARVVADPDGHVFSSAVYGHDEVRKALEALFGRKCAYCEISIARMDWDIEHFRPKGRIAEREEDHPGYYWLAYTWENLFPSCTWCNQHRKARPMWGSANMAWPAASWINSLWKMKVVVLTRLDRT